MTQPSIAIVGHVEWVDFAVVDSLPLRGEIVHAREHFEEPGGGGAVAAVQAQRLAGSALFLTAVGDDALGRRAVDQLEAYGVEVHAAVRPRPQRRAFTHLDAQAERTITVMGDRLVPHGDDDLPWERLEEVDAVYFTGGDPEALRRSRAARVLVATPRAAETLSTAGVTLDVVVASASDPGERVDDAIDTRHVVLTEGAAGGRWSGGGLNGRWVAAKPPGPPVDAYGCGDSFAVGLTYALGARRSLDEALVEAARHGAATLALRGPFGRP